jgi:hypothetical protein
MKSIGLIFLIGGFILNSCTQNKKVDPFLAGPSFKEILSTDSIPFLEYFDSTSNIYSNFYYGFSVNVPKGWTSDRGFSKNTIFRLANYDSGIVFSITINKFLTDQNIPTSLWDPFIQDSSGYIQNFKRGIQDQLGTEILDLKVKPVYYVNQKALKSNYNYLFRSDELEYTMYSEMFQFFYRGNIYTVGLNIPKEFVDKNYSYLLLKNNFNLIPVKYE